MKICSKCKKEKPKNKFSKKKIKYCSNGLYSYCKDCGNIMSNEYKKNNKEKVKLSRHKHYLLNKNYYIKWYKKNQKRIIKQKHKYYIKNKKRINKKNNIYNKTEKGKFIQCIKADKRRQQKLGSSHTLEEWENIKKKNNYKCKTCKKSIKLTRDHIIPLSKGGSNNINNIQPLCGPCNSKKHNKIL